jgi:hypothetical protein
VFGVEILTDVGVGGGLFSFRNAEIQNSLRDWVLGEAFDASKPALGHCAPLRQVLNARSFSANICWLWDNVPRFLGLNPFVKHAYFILKYVAGSLNQGRKEASGRPTTFPQSKPTVRTVDPLLAKNMPRPRPSRVATCGSSPKGLVPISSQMAFLKPANIIPDCRLSSRNDSSTPRANEKLTSARLGKRFKRQKEATPPGGTTDVIVGQRRITDRGIWTDAPSRMPR